MSIMTMARKHLSNLKAARDKAVALAERRSRERVANARTHAEAEKARLQLRREKADIDRELAEARIATRKAEAAAEKARKESGDLSFMERLGEVGRSLGKSASSAAKGFTAKKHTVKRRVAHRKAKTAHRAVRSVRRRR